MKKIPLNKIFLIVFFIVMVLLFFLESANNSENRAFNNEKVASFDQGWKLWVEDRFQGEIALPYVAEAKKNEVVVIERTLPEIGSTPFVMGFRTSQKFVKVFVDDETIYSFGYEGSSAFSKSPGSCWNLVRVPGEHSGKTIKIETISPYNMAVGQIHNIKTGSKATLVLDIFNQYFPNFIMSILLISGGIFVISLKIFFKNWIREKPLLYLGIFNILAGIWTMAEGKFLQMFTGNILLITNVTFLSLSMIPMAFIVFLKSLQIFKNDSILEFLFGMFIANFVIVNVLQFTRVLDYIECLNGNVVLITIMSLYLTVKSIKNIKSKNTEGSEKILYTSIIFACCFGAVDCINFYFGIFGQTVGFFFALGLLITEGMVCVWAIRQALKHYAIQIKSDMLESLAYEDMLTKLGNRTAFEEKLEGYINKTQKNDDTYLLFMDLNDLKKINDNYGHSAGDKAIVALGMAVKEIFAAYGECFRVGGDEFCVVADKVNESLLEKLIERLQDSIGFEKDGEYIDLNVACGYCRYDQGMEIREALERADKAMYLRKKEMKEKARIARELYLKDIQVKKAN